jgi:hypothetical protein
MLAGPLGGELSAEMPFTLTHPKPPESPPAESRKSTKDHTTEAAEENSINSEANNKKPNEVDLIRFDRSFIFLQYVSKYLI